MYPTIKSVRRNAQLIHLMCFIAGMVFTLIQMPAEYKIKAGYVPEHKVVIDTVDYMTTLNQIKKWEGCKLSPYRHNGRVYVGYGHHTTNPSIITQHEADSLLYLDFNARLQIVVDKFPGLSPRQQLALTSLVYNVGHVPTKIAKLIKNNGSESILITEWTSYSSSGGQCLYALKKRRLWEVQFFNDKIK